MRRRTPNGYHDGEPWIYIHFHLGIVTLRRAGRPTVRRSRLASRLPHPRESGTQLSKPRSGGTAISVGSLSYPISASVPEREGFNAPPSLSLHFQKLVCCAAGG